MNELKPMIFALGASRKYGEAIAKALNVQPGRHEERDFEDGEHKTRPLESVRGRDVYVVHSLYGDDDETPNDKLCRMLFFMGSLRDAGAARVTAVTPYLCYARKDRKTKSRDPVTTRYVAGLLESAGASRVVTMDVHNLAAFHNSFRSAVPENLQATKIFASHFAGQAEDSEIVVLSPDAGGVKRAEQFRQALSREMDRPVDNAFLEKVRSSGEVRGEQLVGEVEGKSVIILDDLIGSGGTLARAAKACREKGAKRVRAAATHGLFIKDAEKVLDEPALEKIVITDTVPPFRLSGEFMERKVEVLEVSGVFARAIDGFHNGSQSVEALREYME